MTMPGAGRSGPLAGLTPAVALGPPAPGRPQGRRRYGSMGRLLRRARSTAVIKSRGHLLFSNGDEGPEHPRW